MIEANELRLGNRLLWNRKEQGLPSQEVEVYNIYRSRCRVYTFMAELDEVQLYYSEMDPMPITSDWLLKNGFQWKWEAKDWSQFDKNPANHIPFVIRFEKATKKFMVRNEDPNVFMATVELTSIHQLQNIYFALTGEEL